MLGFLLLVLVPVFLQSPSSASDVVWEKTFGGSALDLANDVHKTNDGGYILLGSTWSRGSGGSDIWLVKVDSAGREEWNKTFGGPKGDEGHSVQQTIDGGYIIIGSTSSSGSGGKDILLIKTDDKGEAEWSRTFGGSGDDEGFSVHETSDSGYILVGMTSRKDRDLFVAKLDSDGNKVWERSYGGPSDEEGYSIQELSDGYIVAGYTKSSGQGGRDLWLLRLDSRGRKVWDFTFGAPEVQSGSPSDEAGRAVLVTGNGSFVVAGGMGLQSDAPRAVLVGVDPEGRHIWARTFGGAGPGELLSARPVGDGYILAGRIKRQVSDGYDAWLVKTDRNGTELWNMTLGGSGDEAGYAAEPSGEGYVMAGLTGGSASGDMWLLKVDDEQKPGVGPDAWLKMGLELSGKGLYEEAVDAFDRAIEADPGYAKAWFVKGNTLTLMNRYDMALKAYDRALEIDPNYTEAWYLKAVVLRTQGDYELALEAFDKSIQTNPRYADAWFGKGLALHTMKRYDEAVPAFDEAIRLKPDDAKAWFYKGNTLTVMGRYGDAVLAYDNATGIDPGYAQAWYLKGLDLRVLGRNGDALAAMDKAIEANPGYAQAWESKGKILSDLNRSSEAEDAMARAKGLEKS